MEDIGSNLDLLNAFLWAIGIALHKYEHRNKEVADIIKEFRRLVKMEFQKLPATQDMPDPEGFLRDKINEYDGESKIEVIEDLNHLLYWLNKVRICS